MAAERLLDALRIKPLEDVANGGVGRRALPVQAERRVQSAAMHLDEGFDRAIRVPTGGHGEDREQQDIRLLYAPETKSLSEVAGLSGCAGVKFRRWEALCVERRGLGDEAGGAVWAGPLRGSDRGYQPTRGGAAFRDRPSDGGEDALVLGAAWLPTQPAAGASEAGSVCGCHRPTPGRG